MFGHLKAQYPGVGVEICYSQRRCDIARLDDDYILSTDGSIKAVLCVDIDSKQSKRATVSVWWPEEVTVEGEEYFQTTADEDAQVCFPSKVVTGCALTRNSAFLTDDWLPPLRSSCLP